MGYTAARPLFKPQAQIRGERRAGQKGPFPDGNDIGFQPKKDLNPSGLALKPDRNFALLNDDRDPALAVGILQHFLHFIVIIAHIMIFHG